MLVKWFQDGREDITCDRRSNCITASRLDPYVERNDWGSKVWKLIDCSDDSRQIELNRDTVRSIFNQTSEHEESVCQMGTYTCQCQLNSEEKRKFALTVKQECWKNLITRKKLLLWDMGAPVLFWVQLLSCQISDFFNSVSRISVLQAVSLALNWCFSYEALYMFLVS
jgi:hypothetical protein